MTADDVTLTEDEIQALEAVETWFISHNLGNSGVWQRQVTIGAVSTVERIVADRLAAVQAELETAKAAQDEAEANEDRNFARAESAERRLAEADSSLLAVGALLAESLARPQPGYVSALALRAALANPPAVHIHDAALPCFPVCPGYRPPALAQHDAEVGARALREAADAIDSGEADHEALRLAGVNEVATYGWSDGSVADAYDSGSVWRDWLRARADALTAEGGQP